MFNILNIMNKAAVEYFDINERYATPKFVFHIVYESDFNIVVALASQRAA